MRFLGNDGRFLKQKALKINQNLSFKTKFTCDDIRTPISELLLRASLPMLNLKCQQHQQLNKDIQIYIVNILQSGKKFTACPSRLLWIQSRQNFNIEFSIDFQLPISFNENAQARWIPQKAPYVELWTNPLNMPLYFVPSLE